MSARTERDKKEIRDRYTAKTRAKIAEEFSTAVIDTAVWDYIRKETEMSGINRCKDVTDGGLHPAAGRKLNIERDPLDVQVGGLHYKTMKIQPVEFCHANSIPFLEANVIKYVCRHKAKGGRKDLEKAKHYIDLLIAMDYGTAEQSPNTGGHPVPPYTPDHLG